MFVVLTFSLASVIVGVILISWTIDISTNAMFDHKVLSFDDVRSVVYLGVAYVVANTFLAGAIDGFSVAGFFFGAIVSLLFTMPLVELIIDVLFPDGN